MNKVKRILKKIIPSFIIEKIDKIRKGKEDILIKSQPIKHKRALKAIRRKYLAKQQIKVAFFVLNSSVWKMKNIYKMMEESDVFEPIIVVCPTKNAGKKNMKREIENTYNFFHEKGYKVIKTYNSINNRYLNIRKSVSPDIIFYTNPYKGLIYDKYFVNKFTDIITCYVPYSFFTTSNYTDIGDTLFYNLMWKVFCETQYHENEIKVHQRIKGRNLVTTGYPGCDLLSDIEQKKLKDPWRKTQGIKRIIWAPHWLPLEIFLRDADFMLNLAESLSATVEIAFKPHPLIKNMLYKKGVWGKTKTDKYFKSWNESENTLLMEDDYEEMFWTSDALIHNSGSFISEYMITEKPCLFVTNNIKYMIKESQFSDAVIKWNDYGEKALKKHYHAYSQEDILSFIKNVVMEGNDRMKEERVKFIQGTILNPNKINPSEVIYDILIDNIKMSLK